MSKCTVKTGETYLGMVLFIINIALILFRFVQSQTLFNRNAQNKYFYLIVASINAGIYHFDD